MRVALLPEGTRGDAQPLLVLGGELVRAGHQALLFGPPDFARLAAERGIDYRIHGPSVRAILADEAGAVLRGGLGFVAAARRYTADALRRQFALADATRGFDLLIGAGLQFGGPSLAEHHGVPYRFVAYTPVILESAEHPAPLASPQTWPRWANRASWAAFRALTRKLAGRELAHGRRALGLPPLDDPYRHLAGEHIWLAADPALAPVPPDVAVATEVLGFLYDAHEAPLPEKLEAFLEAGPAPVYLGFGSMTDPRPERTTEEILAAVRSLGCRAVVSRGWAELGRAALPEQVFVCGPVSHARLFPRVAAVVHHGGAGTTAAAARAGVPQVVVPHLADQFYWAHRVRMAGASPGVLLRRRLRAGRLVPLLREAIENEWIRERARELGVRLRENGARHTRGRRALLAAFGGPPAGAAVPGAPGGEGAAPV